MGKGKRAHFDKNYEPPLSSADLISSKAAAADAVIQGPPPLYKPEVAKTEWKHEEQALEQAPIWVLITTYLSYAILIVYGQIRDFFGFRFKPNEYVNLVAQKGYAPLNSGFDTFYHRRLYTRICDCFNRPITGVPGRTVTLLERVSRNYNRSFQLTGKTIEALNVSSYNYLGFAQNEGPCADAVEASIKQLGVSTCSPRLEGGTLELHQETEALVARFMGQEASMIVSMGFATNSTCLPALVGKGCLIISDSYNHSSLVYGARVSGAAIRIFEHNDPIDLESVLRNAISQGQPRTHRPWKKILVVVEGLYSMEGNICCLPQIIELKRKYKFYLYVDEAHSIGALGPNGRGVCDYFGIDPCEVDVLMGTFTKSFGAAGGYLAGKKDIIDHLRLHSHSATYAESITPPVLQQIYTSLRIIMGEEAGDDGRRRIQQLARNSSYFASELRRMGFIVYGHDSPVVPLLLFHPAKIPAFSREMLKRGIAVVVVGHPATPIITSRVRFCLSAAHTMEDLDFMLQQISEVGDMMNLKVSRSRRIAA
ncbi:pyridoxal phosphate-dependent transferase [Polychytrium aggregatum]|uniref:pyridoxal phosphate-dependent transferase n=1 Tax=Polychytrium aggregatum TaxID=110093 RepID=UPI0022FF4051|nr:pyridoxal phosphate-dependent transferase [Polychytrium aggregatum]KAI9208615.1 pyridoxal phosphate-dependent transferase [Polychytrium aggregatum]